MPKNTSKVLFTAAATGALFAVTGCNTFDRLGEIGEAPRMTNPQNPTARPGYKPVVMPMPAPQQIASAPNSLWRTGSRAFFKDQRAANIGDIITVVVNIDDQAVLNASTNRTRTNTEDASANAFLGYEGSLHQILPQAIQPNNLVNLDSATSNQGAGQVTRDEDIELKIAAVVTQILPNGNLVIQGRQEIRVNFEMRELEIGGVIRPEDIASDNTVNSEKVAEARIAYGGRGVSADFQQPRAGQQFYDVLFPF